MVMVHRVGFFIVRQLLNPLLKKRDLFQLMFHIDLLLFDLHHIITSIQTTHLHYQGLS